MRHHVSPVEEPSVSAVVGVLHDRGRFLLIQRAEGIPYAGWWTPPSGRIEPGESAADALMREMREELGLEVRPLREVWTCLTLDGTCTLQWWLLETDDWSLTPEPSEVGEAAWFTVDEMRELSPTFEDDIRFFSEIWPTLSTGQL
jgi:8-oxo-dGTP diphosphatase